MRLILRFPDIEITSKYLKLIKGTIQLIVDVNPSSCDNQKYTKRLEFSVNPKNRKNPDDLIYFSFYDQHMPTNQCQYSIYLQMQETKCNQGCLLPISTRYGLKWLGNYRIFLNMTLSSVDEILLATDSPKTFLSLFLFR